MRVDARDPTALTTVAGLPLVARHARVLFRCGFRSARFFVDDEERRSGTLAALRRHPPPPGMAVDVRVGEPDGPALDGARVYAPQEGGPLSIGDARSPEGRREAERRLFERLRKSVDLDGVVAYYVMRPVSRVLTRLLLPTAVRPNQVTMAAMACGVTAAALAAAGDAALAGLLFWIGAAIDCVDGDLARLRLQGSRLGEWLDTLADDVSTLGLLCGLGLGLWVDGHGQTWQLLGIGGAVVGVVTGAKLYADLHRLGLPIDTAQYPWFFGAPSGKRGPLGRVFYAVSFLFRRDAFVTVIAVLLAFGQRRSALLLLFGGTLVFGALLCVHMWVTRRRQPGGILATNK